MPTSRRTPSISDSRRDAERHHRLLLALKHATGEIRRMEEEGYPDIDEMLDRLLPDLAAALNAKHAFVAVPQENGDRGKKWFELTTVYPRKDLRGYHLEWSDLLQQLIKDGKPRVIDPLGEEARDPIPGLEIFDATSAILVRTQLAGQMCVVGMCNKADPNRGPFLAGDKMAFDNIVELVAIGVRVGERRRRELESIQRTSAAISAELDLDELLPMIAKGAAEVFDAPATSLMLWDESGENLVTRAKWGLSDEYMQRQRIPREKVYATVESIGGFQPLLTPDLQLEPFGDIDLIRSERLRTVLSAPLLVGDQLIGILNIYSKNELRQFSPYDIELSQILANQAAIAIQNARLRRRELEGLLVTSGAIRAALDPDVLLELITSKASKAFGAPATSLMLWNEAEEKLVIMASEGLSNEYALQQTIPKEKVYAAVASNGMSRYFIIPDLRLEPLGQPELDEKECLCTVLGTPFLVSDKLIGVLNIYSKNEPREFTQDEIELATIFANQAAIAIENAKLYQETQRRVNEFSGLYQISQAISSAADIHQVCAHLNERISTLMAVGMCGVLLYDEREEALVSQPPFYGVPDELVHRYKIPLVKGSLPWCLWQEEDFLIFNDALNEPLTDELGFREMAEMAGVRATVYVPMTVGSRRIGVIQASNKLDGSDFTEDDARLLCIFANQAAVVVENSRLFQSLDRKMQQLDHLRKIGQALAGAVTDSPKEMLGRVARSACEVIGADCAVFYPYHASSRAYDTQNIAAHGLKTQLTQKEKPRVYGQSVTGRVMEERLVVLNDIAKEDPSLQQHRFINREGIRAFVAIRLDVSGEAVGALFVNFRSPHQFTDDELDTAEIFANQAATSVQKARLFERVRSLLERKLTEMAGLREVDKLISSTIDPMVIWEHILDTALGITGAEHGWISFVDRQTGELIPEVIRGISQKRLDKIRARFGESGITGWVAKERRSVLVGDIKEEPWSQWYVESIKSTRSELAVPILRGDKLLGVINLESPKRYAFDQDDQKLLEALADSAAIAVQNAQLYQQVNKRAQMLASLQEVGQEITEELELTQVLRSIVENAVRVLDADISTVFPYKEGEGFSLGLGIVDGAARPFPCAWTPRDNSLTVQVLSAKKAIVIEDVKSAPLAAKSGIVRTEKIQSFVCAPLLAGQNVLGLLYVDFRQPRKFTEEELRAIRLFTNYAAIAIQNARLYEATKRRGQHWQALCEASKAIAAGFAAERKQVLDCITEQAVERITGIEGPKAVWSSIMLYDEVANQLQFESVYPHKVLPELKAGQGDRWLLDRDKAPDGRIGITGRTVLERKPQRVEDVWTDPDYLEFNFTTRSELDVPLLDDGRVVGVLSVESDQRGAFDEDDEEALKGLAELAVIVLKNAERQSELLKTKEQLAARSALAWAGMMSSTWFHTIRGNTANIRDNVELLLRSMPDSEEYGRHRERLKQIDTQARQILDEKMTGPLPSEDIVESVGLNALIEERVNYLCRRYGEITPHYYLKATENVSVRVVRRWLMMAIGYLVQNALDAMTSTKESPQKLIISSRVIANMAEVLIADTGPGIQEEILNKLGKECITKRAGEKGAGWGWLMVKMILQSYGGDAEIRSTGPEGTTVRVSVPIEQR